jgi:hypothetical protein
VDEGTTSDHVEVRISFRQGEGVTQHAEGGPCRDAADAADAVRACVCAALPSPLAVLALAVEALAYAELAGLGDSREARLADALYAAARDYAGFRRESVTPATPPED